MARLILTLDGQVLAEYNMSKERYTVGRLPDNDVRIDNPAVSGHHSLIINILSDSFLEDLSSTNGTYVNGKLIKKHALQHGDVITIGRHQLRFVDSRVEEEDEDEFARTMVIDEDDAAVAEAVGRSRLNGGDATAEARRPGPLSVARAQVLSGNFAGREVALNKAVTTLGSKGRQVIAITRRADGYFVVMVENADGQAPATVNGEALDAKARPLADNDVIEVVGIG